MCLFPTDSSPNSATPCRRCQHYHGRSYNGVLFNCAIAPYGLSQSSCDSYIAVPTSTILLNSIVRIAIIILQSFLQLSCLSFNLALATNFGIFTFILFSDTITKTFLSLRNVFMSLPFVIVDCILERFGIHSSIASFMIESMNNSLSHYLLQDEVMPKIPIFVDSYIEISTPIVFNIICIAIAFWLFSRSLRLKSSRR